MIECIYLVLEILTFLLIINDLHNKKFKWDFLAIITVTVVVLAFWSARKGWTSEICLWIPYIVLFIYCKLEFPSNIRKTIIYLIVAFMFLGILQLITGSLSFVIDNEDLCDLSVNVINLILILLLVRNNSLFKVLSYIRENSRMLTRIILCSGIIFVFVLISYFFYGKFTILEYFLILMFYILLVGLVLIWKREHDKLIYKTEELNAFNKFHEQERQLYQDVRKRQHEFKNQLNALYSTHYTCATYEELVAAQKDYAEWITEKNQYNDLLISCKPSVLAGFIYNQVELARKMGFEVDYSVSVVNMEDTDREYDYICVFGVLFDNAMEAVKDCPDAQKKIEFVLTFDGKNTKLEMRNVSDYVHNSSIKKWFKESFSTKDRNRGYGLSNVIYVKNKYHADIVVENVNKQRQNWLSISFVIH
ncbi:MAG: GHKL domain-containing protein [Lachnospiraceae bacterium]|mgnify:CR=1 FL=1|nr:GHKL domain-containing protein [Lachnospiraceae bacterium]